MVARNLVLLGGAVRGVLLQADYCLPKGCNNESDDFSSIPEKNHTIVTLVTPKNFSVQGASSQTVQPDGATLYWEIIGMAISSHWGWGHAVAMRRFVANNSQPDRKLDVAN